MAYLVSVVKRHFAKRTERLHQRLNYLGAAAKAFARARDNFWRDSRPNAMTWKVLVRAVLGARLDPSELYAAIRNAIDIATKSGAESPPARISATSLIFGRVIGEDDYFRRMFEPRAALPVTEKKRAAYIRWVLDRSLDEQRTILDRAPLGKYKMWSTFDQRSFFPFDGFLNDPTRIRASLGLDECTDPTDDDLLIFEYTLPAGTTPRIPTVCDAYAGPSWPAYFLPAPPTARHGFTDPWDGSGMKKCPEVVHDVITGRMLAAKVRRVRK